MMTLKKISLSITILLLISMYLVGNVLANPEINLVKSIISDYKNKEYQQCIEKSKIYLKKFKGTKNVPLVLLVFGISSYKIGEKENAIKILKVNNKRYPDYKKNSQVKLLLAQLYFETGQFKKSQQMCKKFLSKYPDSPQAQKILDIQKDIKTVLSTKVTIKDIIKAYREKKFDKSFELSRIFIIKNSGDKDRTLAYYLNAVSAIKLEKFPVAIKSLTFIINNDREFNKYDQVLYLRGYSYFKEKKNLLAKRDLQKLKLIIPDSKYISNADNLLRKIESEERISTSNQGRKGDGKSEYSFTKTTWAKICSGTSLILSPIFLILANNEQAEADSIYNNNYMNATLSESAVAYWNEVVDRDKKAATLKTYSLISLGAAVAFFAIDYFIVGRNRVEEQNISGINEPDKFFSFNINDKKKFRVNMMYRF